MTISAFPATSFRTVPDAWKPRGKDDRHGVAGKLTTECSRAKLRALNRYPNVEGVEACSNESSSESRNPPKAWLRFARQLACSQPDGHLVLTAVAEVALAVHAGWAATAGVGRHRERGSDGADAARVEAPGAERCCSTAGRRSATRDSTEPRGGFGGRRNPRWFTGRGNPPRKRGHGHAPRCALLGAHCETVQRRCAISTEHLRGRGRFAELGPSRGGRSQACQAFRRSSRQGRCLWRDEDQLGRPLVNRTRRRPGSPTSRSKRSSSEPQRQTRTCSWSGAEACMAWPRSEASASESPTAPAARCSSFVRMTTKTDGNLRMVHRLARTGNSEPRVVRLLERLSRGPALLHHFRCLQRPSGGDVKSSKGRS